MSSRPSWAIPELNYEIGANVQGNVTIQTSQPLKRSQVLPVVQQALKLNGVALVFASGRL